MKVLLTGATGFLGSHIAEALAKQGHHVRCLMRSSSDNTFLATLANIEYSEGHLNDEVALQKAVAGVDAVIHAAGLVKARHVADFDKVNVQGTQQLLQAVYKQAPHLKRFVLISSLAAVGAAADGIPLQENTLTVFKPVTEYGRSKQAAEQQALLFADKLPVTIIRPPLIYGPRDKECLAFFRLVQYKMFPFFGDKNTTASVIYASDAAQACYQALHAETMSGNAYFIEDGTVYRVCDMMAQLANISGHTLWFKPVLPVNILKTIAFIAEYYGKLSGTAVMLTRDKVNELVQPHWVCNSHKAQHELKWQPATSWARGAQLTYDWYKKAGWL